MNLDLREIPFYYINLDDAVERRERTESQLKELGIKHVTRIEAIRHEYGAAGTPRSMLAALKLARTIPYGKHFIDQDDIDAVIHVLKNKNLTQGPAILSFEKAISIAQS